MSIKKIHFLGLSDALKPLYILQYLQANNFFNKYQVEFIGNDNVGKVIDFCINHNIKYYTINELKINQELSADILIVIGWSFLLKEDILSKYNIAINCHGGLLPDYRGNNTYMHAFANIEQEYGATLHYINSTFDDGNIICQGALRLYKEETPEILHRRICEITALMIPNALNKINNNEKGIKQIGTARYFYKITKEEMWKIRMENEERLKKGLPLIICKNKKWDLN